MDRTQKQAELAWSDIVLNSMDAEQATLRIATAIREAVEEAAAEARSESYQDGYEDGLRCDET